MNIAVYLGSTMGNSDVYRSITEDIGSWIGKNGHRLIYGGSKTGLMGVLADACLGAGGYVIGVEPKMFIETELQHDGISELIITEDTIERKRKMLELSDAFIAMPGGTGTLDEMTETVELMKLSGTPKPCIYFNHDGYYEEIRTLMQRMMDCDFLDPDAVRSVHFAGSVEEIEKIL